jgi:hypothetical protein
MAVATKSTPKKEVPRDGKCLLNAIATTVAEIQPMNRTTAFLLLVRRDETGAVEELKVALDRPTADKDGQPLVTPAVVTADEFESAVNALQAELDAMRAQGRRCLASGLTCSLPKASGAMSARPALSWSPWCRSPIMRGVRYSSPSCSAPPI